MGKLKNFTQNLILIAIIISSSIIIGVIFEKQRELNFSSLNILQIPFEVKNITFTENKNGNKEQIEQNSEVQQDTGEKNETELSETNWQWLENQKKLYKLNSTEINFILTEIQKRFPDKFKRLKALSILRLGTPYQLGCLGEEAGRDKDPIFRLDITDCTAFVLTNVALLHSQSLAEAREMMRYLNYQPNSEMTFENRLHFTTDRNEVSPYFQDITGEVLCGCSLKAVEVTLNKIKADGERLIDINWEKETVFRYIPNEYITKELFQNLPKALGIAFIKKGDEEIGLDVRHEGFLFDGELLFHASSAKGEVVSEDFFGYYFGENSSSRFDGVILFEIK